MKTLSPSEKLTELNMEVRALDRKSEAGTLTVTERGTMDLLEERIMHAEAEVSMDRIWARMKAKREADKEAKKVT